MVCDSQRAALSRYFFDAECMVTRLFGTNGCRGDAVEFRCGYGTFTLPGA